MDEKIERMKELLEVISRSKSDSGKLLVQARCKVCKVREGRIDLIRKHIRRVHAESLAQKNETATDDPLSGDGASSQIANKPNKTSDDLINKVMEFVEILDRYKTAAGNNYVNARCKICPLKTGRVDEVRRHIKKVHKDSLDIADDNSSILIHSSNEKNSEEKPKSNHHVADANDHLGRSEMISLLIERLDKKKKIGDRIISFSRCKECNLESRNDSIRRHIKKRHSKLLARKIFKGSNERSGGNVGGRPKDTELTRTTEPFIEVLSKQRYPTTGKMFTVAKCKICPKTARIDRVRRHVAKEHSGNITTEHTDTHDSESEDFTIVATEDSETMETNEEDIQVVDCDQNEEEETTTDVSEFIEVLNKILSRCKICSKAANKEEITNHILSEHQDALPGANTTTIEEEQADTNPTTKADEEKAAMERFSETLEPRVFGNEKFKRTCYKCTICETVFRKDRIGKHILSQHRDHISNQSYVN